MYPLPLHVVVSSVIICSLTCIQIPDYVVHMLTALSNTPVPPQNVVLGLLFMHLLEELYTCIFQLSVLNLFSYVLHNNYTS